MNEDRRDDDELLEELARRCLERMETEGPAALDAVCRENPDVASRLREVVQALAGVGLLSPTQSLPDPAVSFEDAAPERIGPYRILSVLGEGGMGTVYLAEQKQPVRRRVALKVIKLGMDSKQVLNRFEAERQALAMMEHSNIAKVFEAGTTERGQPYFVMEYVRGIPITDHCDQHNASIEERIELFRQICSGIQHAHQKGVMHRDLKPSNVLVTVQEGQATPKIIDFGLARATDHRLVEATIFTEQGVILGTPEYMSPEQTGLSGQDVDTRTDVYSLGVLLYELLVGELPFSPHELRQAGHAEMERKIKEEDPPKPSTKLSRAGDSSAHAARRRRTDTRSLLRRLRADLDWVVMMAIEKDRTRRYETPAALAEDLRRFLEHEPVLAGPPSAGYRLRKLVRRYRGQVVAGVLVLFSLLVGVVAFAIENARAGRANDELADINMDLEWVAFAGEMRRAQEDLQVGRLGGLARRLTDLDEDRRGFAWQWLHARAENPEPVRRLGTPGGTPAAVMSIEASPDDERLLCLIQTDTGREARVVSANTAELILRIPGTVEAAAFSPDGSHIVTGNASGQLILWDAESGDELDRENHGSRVQAVCFSRDGRVASVGPYGSVRIASATDLSEINRIEGSGDATDRWVLEFSPSGDRILVSGEVGTAEIRDADIGKLLHVLPYSRQGDEHVTSGCFSPDGRLILLTGYGGRVAIWDAGDGGLVRDLQPHRQENSTGWQSFGGSFSPDGRWAISCGFDAILRVHSVRTGQTVGSFRVSPNVRSASFSSDGLTVLDGGGTNDVGGFTVRRLADLPIPVELLGHGQLPITEVLTTRDGKSAFSVDRGDETVGSVRKWDLETGAPLFSVELRGFFGRSMDLSPDQAHLAVVGISGRGMVLDTTTGALVQRFLAPPELVRRVDGYVKLGLVQVRYSPDGRTIAAGVGNHLMGRDPDRDAPILLFDASTDEPTLRIRNTLTGHQESIGEIAFSPDGTRLASVGFDDRVILWNLDAQPPTGLELELGSPQGSSVVAFDPTGERIYVALGDLQDDRQIVVLDALTGERVGDELPGQHGYVYELDFHTDNELGRLMVTTPKGASIWDLPPKNRLMELSFGDGLVQAARFVGDGTGIIAGGDGFLRFLEIEPRPELFEARRAVERATAILLEPPTATSLDTVREALDSAPGLSGSVRGLLMARALNEAAWSVLSDPSATGPDLEVAVSQARDAVAGALPGSFAEAAYRDTLGVGLLRTGSFEEAAKELERSHALASRHPEGRYAITSTLAFLACAHRELGQADKAREKLDLAWQNGLWTLNDAPAVEQARERLEVQLPSGDRVPLYHAEMAVGPPDAVFGWPDVNGWAPAAVDGIQWLEVSFDKPQRVSTVRIYELQAPGGEAEIVAVDPSGGEHAVWSGEYPMEFPGVFEVPIDTADFDVRTLRIIVDTDRSTGATERIDTVEVVGADGRQWPVSASASSTMGPVLIDVDPSLLQLYVGEYELDEVDLIVGLSPDGLTILGPDGMELPLFAVSETEFVMAEYPTRITFERDADGVPIAMLLDRGGTLGRAVKKR